MLSSLTLGVHTKLVKSCSGSRTRCDADLTSHLRKSTNFDRGQSVDSLMLTAHPPTEVRARNKEDLVLGALLIRGTIQAQLLTIDAPGSLP